MSEHFDSVEDRDTADIADSTDEPVESGALEDERPDEGGAEAEAER